MVLMQERGCDSHFLGENGLRLVDQLKEEHQRVYHTLLHLAVLRRFAEALQEKLVAIPAEGSSYDALSGDCNQDAEETSKKLQAV